MGLVWSGHALATHSMRQQLQIRPVSCQVSKAAAQLLFTSGVQQRSSSNTRPVTVGEGCNISIVQPRHRSHNCSYSLLCVTDEIELKFQSAMQKMMVAAVVEMHCAGRHLVQHTQHRCNTHTPTHPHTQHAKEQEHAESVHGRQACAPCISKATTHTNTGTLEVTGGEKRKKNSRHTSPCVCVCVGGEGGGEQ